VRKGRPVTEIARGRKSAVTTIRRPGADNLVGPLINRRHCQDRRAMQVFWGME